MTEQSLPVQEIAGVLWRRRALIGVVFAVGLLTVFVVVWLQAPSYRASAKLMVTSARATLAVSPDANERPRVDPVTDSYMSSEVAMLGSATLLREVLEPYRERMRPAAPTGFARVRELLSYPFNLPGQIYRAIHGLPPGGALDEWAADMAHHLTVTQVGRSNLIEVAFEHRNPNWAAELVNNLLAHHVERHVRMNQQNSAQQFYEAQRALLTDKLRAAEEAQRNFYERESIDSATKGLGLTELRTRVAQLESALADAETELAESSAAAQFLGHALATSPRGGGAGGSSGGSLTAG